VSAVRIRQDHQSDYLPQGAATTTKPKKAAVRHCRSSHEPAPFTRRPFECPDVEGDTRGAQTGPWATAARSRWKIRTPDVLAVSFAGVEPEAAIRLACWPRTWRMA